MIILKYKVYKHTNEVNGKVYIGITHYSDPNKRWKNGLGYKPYGKNSVSHLYHAIQKYGWDKFKSTILHSNLNYEEACNKEIELIKEYNSTNNECGYNKHPGGSNGVPLTEEAKRKISIANSGDKNGMYGVVGANHPRYGMEVSLETRAKLRKAHLGREPWNKGKTGIYSMETRAKISDAHKGNKYNLGKKHTKETKDKIRESTYIQWESEDFRRIVSEANIGNKNSGKSVVCGEYTFPTIKECAEYLGVHRKTVSRWLKGVHPIPEKYKQFNIRYENTEITK